MRFRLALDSSRVHWAMAGALLATFVLLAWMQRVPSITTANDDATYIILSRSISDGGYHSTHLVGAPLHTKYPPVYPALLAIVTALAGESTTAISVMNIALLTAALALVAAAALRITAPVVALGALAVMVFSGFMQSMAGGLMSEPTFALLVAATLWLLVDREWTSARIALACLCATLAFGTRTIGVTLIVALAIALLVQGRRRAAAMYAAVLVSLGLAGALAVASQSAEPFAAEYLREGLGALATSATRVIDIGKRLATNAAGYATGALWLLSFPTIRGTIVDNALWLAFAIVTGLVGIRALFSTWRVSVIFVVVYGALLLVWQWPIRRFLLPILPLLALAVLLGLHTLALRRRPTYANALVVGLATVLSLSGLLREREALAAKRGCRPAHTVENPACYIEDQRGFFAAARFAASRTPANEPVMTAKEATFHYLTGRIALPRDELLARPNDSPTTFLRANGVSTVVLGHLSFEDIALARRLRQECGAISLDSAFAPRALVLRIETPTATRPACAALDRYLLDAGEFPEQLF